MKNREAIRYLELIKGYLPDDHFLEKNLEALNHAIDTLKNPTDVQVGTNSVVILGSTNLPNNAAIGCGASVGGFLEQDADVVAGFKPFKPYDSKSNILVGPSAGECLEPGCKSIVNPGECLDNILFRKFERASDD